MPNSVSFAPNALYFRGLVTAMWLIGSVGPTADAQQRTDWEGNRIQMSRPALEDLLRLLDASAQSSGYSSSVRNQARNQAAVIRARLAQGDFQVGDRVYLRVEGEQQLTDTFTVGPDDALQLPMVGAVSLQGVLHSELQLHLRDTIATYVRNPIVHAHGFTRIAVLGEVTRPGFYTVPAQTLVTEVLMFAGGPSHDAKMKDLRILRGDEPVVEGGALREAMAQGRTLDQLNLVAGDYIQVPKQKPFLSTGTLAFVSLLLGIPGAVYGLTRLFGN